ncbi:MAG: hypothetical protein ACE5I2_13065, partial [Anaerolineae bacterium]
VGVSVAVGRGVEVSVAVGGGVDCPLLGQSSQGVDVEARMPMAVGVNVGLPMLMDGTVGSLAWPRHPPSSANPASKRSTNATFLNIAILLVQF